MMTFSPHMTGILQGQKMMFTDFQTGGPMWTGEGPREVRQRVHFATPFLQAPAVIVGISLWDSDRRTNLRADLCAESVTAEGFELVFRTWGDSRVARIRADWTAIGAVRDERDWLVD
ncbi:hypothetical protein EP867_12780 [Falsigemmobacter intermedius]|uniref:H-type lectin domain-containing protein n=3 Tax=Falsigemmobacter intermedius TaxID=1553448 RepID=A0A444MA06_9RHOB|nr:hypothetical protein EP867_12780 [Falsigemmobacter intermedius]